MFLLTPILPDGGIGEVHSGGTVLFLFFPYPLIFKSLANL